MPRLYLIRHAETSHNASGIYQGQTDSALSELGHDQARLLAQRLAEEELTLDQLYSSVSGRALQTSEYISQITGKAIIENEGLQEINLGNWEGLTWNQICDKFPQESKRYHENWWNFCEHGGESWKQAQNRFFETIVELIQKSLNQNLMIVSHAGVIRMLVAKILESNCPRPPIDISNTGITEVSFSDHQLRISRLNDQNHLISLNMRMTV